MTQNTNEPSTDPKEIMFDMEGEITDLVGAVDTLYGFTKRYEGPEEEASSINYLHGEIHVHTRAIKEQYYRLHEAMKPRPPL